MKDYSRGKIYTIRSKIDPALIYVGSTIQPLAKRWGCHKATSLTKMNRLLYKTINGEWDNFYIELHELSPCNSKEELCKREGQIIREIATLNGRIAGRTKKDWLDDNKEYYKIYYLNNEDKLKSYQKAYQKAYYEKKKASLKNNIPNIIE